MAGESTIEVHKQLMPYDKVCGECGEPAAIVITIRDWCTADQKGYPSTHLVCPACARKLRDRLNELLL